MTLRLLCSVLFIAFGGLVHAEDKNAKVRVVLAGDSTVTDTSGWGKAFAGLLKPEAECVNLARSGNSSKSFRDNGSWQKVLDAKPTFVLIQFGHNDMPGKGPQRETDPKTTFRKNMERFVQDVRDLGATPILVTSMARRTFDNDKIRGELAPYAEAVRAVAVEKKVPLVDLFTRSVELLNKLGPSGSAYMNPAGKNGAEDHTHLNAKGADTMAKLVAEELHKAAPDLAKFLGQ